MTTHASFTSVFYVFCFVIPTLGGIFFKIAVLVERRFLPLVEMTMCASFPSIQPKPTCFFYHYKIDASNETSSCCGLPFLKALRGFKPSSSNIAMSVSKEGFGVVRSLSPANKELAPAIKHKACSTVLISVLPADKRTTVFGMMILVVAIIRTMSQTETRG